MKRAWHVTLCATRRDKFIRDTLHVSSHFYTHDIRPWFPFLEPRFGVTNIIARQHVSSRISRNIRITRQNPKVAAKRERLFIPQYSLAQRVSTQTDIRTKKTVHYRETSVTVQFLEFNLLHGFYVDPNTTFYFIPFLPILPCKIRFLSY